MSIDKGKLYYFASPYSHKNAFVTQIRYEIVNYIATQMLEEGYLLIEPIAMCHNKAKTYGLDGSYKTWMDRDRGFISKSDGIIVVCLTGWEKSEGIEDEVRFAKSLDKEVTYLDPAKYIPKEVWSQIHLQEG